MMTDGEENRVANALESIHGTLESILVILGAQPQLDKLVYGQIRIQDNETSGLEITDGNYWYPYDSDRGKRIRDTVND